MCLIREGNAFMREWNSGSNVFCVLSWQDWQQSQDQAEQDLGRPEWRHFGLQLRWEAENSLGFHFSVVCPKSLFSKERNWSICWQLTVWLASLLIANVLFDQRDNSSPLLTFINKHEYVSFRLRLHRGQWDLWQCYGGSVDQDGQQPHPAEEQDPWRERRWHLYIQRRKR